MPHFASLAWGVHVSDCACPHGVVVLADLRLCSPLFQGCICTCLHVSLFLMGCRSQVGCLTGCVVQVINPKKDLPVGLMGSLGVVTTLYLLMAATIILIVPYTKIDPKAAFAAAFQVCQPIHIRCLPPEHDAQPTWLDQARSAPCYQHEGE